MEFHEKLQQLRREKGLTQEEVARELFVSRAAVSKWEQGRGYPNIDSLRAIGKFYGVSIDELLSGEEVLTIAQREGEEARRREQKRLFGLLDWGGVLLFLLPIFADRSEGFIHGVSLLAFDGAPYLKAAYLIYTAAMVAMGIFTLAAGSRRVLWDLVLNGAGVLLFAITLQPYGAALLLLFLMVKVLYCIKRG